MTARLCMYKGPASGLKNKLGELIVCLATRSRYSHVELEINGVCYSSSFRDGGVRAARIPDLETSGHWDLYPLALTHDEEGLAVDRFKFDYFAKKPYDWLGMLRVCRWLRWLPRRDGARFCSEEVAYMLGAPDPETMSPQDVLERYRKEAL